MMFLFFLLTVFGLYVKFFAITCSQSVAYLLFSPKVVLWSKTFKRYCVFESKFDSYRKNDLDVHKVSLLLDD